MRTKEFARILVEDIVEAGENNPSEWLRNNGIATRNLNDKDEIWKLFVRYNINTGGVKDEIVEDHWNRISDNSILKNRQLLLNSILSLENDECYSNFSYLCPVRFKKDRGFSGIKCEDTEKFSKCPVIAITKELSWHRQHYKVAKIIVECAKRLLIEDGHGRNEGNLNDVVRGVFSKHEGNEANWRITATNEIISKFDNIKGYGRPSKVITWVLSDLGSPVHELSHWPDFDLSQLWIPLYCSEI